jgi:hypothetical protein
MRQLAAVLVCGALAGCRISTGPASALALEVAASQSSVRAGQNLSVTVTATNVGEIPITYFSPDCAFPIEVRDAGGTVVEHPVAIICAAVATGPRTLLPGARQVFTTVWITRTWPQQTPVAPGVYQISPANFHVRGAAVEHRRLSVTVTN